MSTETKKHAAHADRLLDHADDMVEAKDRLQASEKIWGSVAHTLKEVAERHGWPNKAQSDLVRIAAYMAAVSRDPDMRTKFFAVRSFHTNFYEDEYDLTDIKEGVDVAEGLVEQLRAADERYQRGERPRSGADTPNDHHEKTNKAAQKLTEATLRQMGLPANEAAQAAAIINRAQADRARVSELAFTVGVEQRPVKMDKHGKLTVGKPRAPRRSVARDYGIKKGGFKLPSIRVRHRR